MKKNIIVVVIAFSIVAMLATIVLISKRSSGDYSKYTEPSSDLSNKRQNAEITEEYDNLISSYKTEDDVLNDTWSLIVDYDDSYESLDDLLWNALLNNEYSVYSVPRFYPIGEFITDVTVLTLSKNNSSYDIYCARCKDNKVYVYVYDTGGN